MQRRANSRTENHTSPAGMFIQPAGTRGVHRVGPK